MKLFHVTREYYGNKVLFTPRVPPGQSVIELRGKYSHVPRICLSDTIDKCLLGITKMKLSSRMYVYRPIGRYKIDWDSPRDACPDWDITDECWLLEPTEFEFVCEISCDTDIMTPTISWKRIRRKNLPSQTLSETQMSVAP